MINDLTHAIAKPMTRRRVMAATTGLVLGLSAFSSAYAAR